MEALDLLAILGSECIVRKKSATTAPYHSHSFVPRRQFGDTTSFNTAISACSSGFAWLSLVEWWCFRSTWVIHSPSNYLNQEQETGQWLLPSWESWHGTTLPKHLSWYCAMLPVFGQDCFVAWSSEDAISFRAAISACEGGNCWKEARSLASLCKFPSMASHLQALNLLSARSSLKIACALVLLSWSFRVLGSGNGKPTAASWDHWVQCSTLAFWMLRSAATPFQLFFEDVYQLWAWPRNATCSSRQSVHARKAPNGSLHWGCLHVRSSRLFHSMSLGRRLQSSVQSFLRNVAHERLLRGSCRW